MIEKNLEPIFINKAKERINYWKSKQRKKDFYAKHKPTIDGNLAFWKDFLNTHLKGDTK